MLRRVTAHAWAPALRHLRAADPRLGPVIDRHGPPAMATAPTHDPLRALARAIVYQQLSGKAAGTIWARWLAGYPRRRFPSAAAILATPVEALRAAGLSAAKGAALHDLAARVVARRLAPRRLAALPDAEVAAALLPVRGLGPWTVDMFLMFALGRPDVLPVGDLGVRKGLRRHFGLRALPDPARMRRLAAPWAPFRSAAAWYMWRVAEEVAGPG